MDRLRPPCAARHPHGGRLGDAVLGCRRTWAGPWAEPNTGASRRRRPTGGSGGGPPRRPWIPCPRYWAQMSARRSQVITAWYSAFSRPPPTYSFVATEKVATCFPEASARISGSRVSRPVKRTLFTVRSLLAGPAAPGSGLSHGRRVEARRWRRARVDDGADPPETNPSERRLIGDLIGGLRGDRRPRRDAGRLRDADRERRRARCSSGAWRDHPPAGASRPLPTPRPPAAPGALRPGAGQAGQRRRGRGRRARRARDRRRGSRPRTCR